MLFHQKIVRMLVRTWWLAIVPAGLTALAAKGLLPGREYARGDGLLAEAARLSNRFDVPIIVGLFLLSAGLVRYWGKRLPGGTHLESVGAPRPSRWRAASSVAALAVVSAAALFCRANVLESHQVMSASMVPTLLPADNLLTEKLAYRSLFGRGATQTKLPARGDVVVFPASERSTDQKHLVKRVIGLPGDKIDVHMGSVSINGWKVPSCNAGSFIHAIQNQLIMGRIAVEFLGDEAYLTVKVPEDSEAGSYTVLPGEVFVMGDNRGFSEDSRVWMYGRQGGVSIQSIEGRVRRLLVGRDGSGALDASRSLSALRPALAFTHMNMAALDAGVANCLKTRPITALPPAAHLAALQ